MRHVNSNMIVHVQAGIARGEASSDPAALVAALAVAADMTAQLRPLGDRPVVVSAYTKSKALAHAQGFIAGFVW